MDENLRNLKQLSSEVEVTIPTLRRWLRDVPEFEGCERPNNYGIAVLVDHDAFMEAYNAYKTRRAEEQEARASKTTTGGGNGKRAVSKSEIVQVLSMAGIDFNPTYSKDDLMHLFNETLAQEPIPNVQERFVELLLKVTQYYEDFYTA